MEHSALVVDTALHVALFIAAGGTLALGGVALLERVTAGPRPVVRWRTLVVAALATIALFTMERLYHSL